MTNVNIEFDWSDAPNLVKLVTPFSKSLLQGLGYDRQFEVLKRRYGLEGSDSYTLQEVGDFYGVTRERVRQIEAKAIRKVHDALFKQGVLSSLQTPSDIVQECITLSNLMKDGEKLLTQGEIVTTLENRYNFIVTNNDLGSLRLLLHILGFNELPTKISGFSGELSPSWFIDTSVDLRILHETVKFLHKIVLQSVTPVSMFDLMVKLNRQRKQRIENEYILLASKYCKEIEMINGQYFQMAFEFLPSLADKAYRVLSEATHPLPLREITREISRRLAKAAIPTDVPVRSLQNQLVSDSRFEAIGRSGRWSLSERQDVRRESIVELMKEFFLLKQDRATANEVYTYVHSKRPGVSKHSIGVYLSTKKAIFVRVSDKDYELAAWGSKAHTSHKRLDSIHVQSKFVKEIASIYTSKQVSTLYVSELVRELANRTNIPISTLFIKVRRSPLLEIQNDPAGSRHKIAKYLGDQSSSLLVEKKTLRVLCQEQIRRFLKSRPQQQALLTDIAYYVMKQVGCKKPTFYRYLSEMEDLIKEELNGKVYCRLKADDHPLLFPQVEHINDNSLRDNLSRTVSNVSVNNVDLVLFQLGKIFETELKAYLLEAQAKNSFPVTTKDVDRLVSMIDCVERNGIIKDKHVLTFLRQERNERAHGQIPALEERERLLEQIPYLGGMFIDYISFFHKKRMTL